MTFNISQAQAREFASCVVNDIAKYIEEHQVEYKAFVTEQEAERGGETQC